MALSAIWVCAILIIKLSVIRALMITKYPAMTTSLDACSACGERMRLYRRSPSLAISYSRMAKVMAQNQSCLPMPQVILIDLGRALPKGLATSEEWRARTLYEEEAMLQLLGAQVNACRSNAAYHGGATSPWRVRRIAL